MDLLDLLNIMNLLDIFNLYDLMSLFDHFYHLDLVECRPRFGPCGFNLKILENNVLNLFQHCVKEQLREVRHAPMKKCFRLVVPFFEALSSGVNKQLLKIGTYLLYYRLKLRVETFNPDRQSL